MGHTHITITEERFEFTAKARRQIIYLLLAGVVLLALGLVISIFGGEAHHGSEHHGLSAPGSSQLVASLDTVAPAEGHGEGGAHHEEKPTWLKRLYTTLWMNNIYFIGLGIIGLFFVSIQYAAQAGWSAGIKRIPLAMGQWLPVAFVSTLVLWFITHHDVFHWTHSYLYDKNNPETFDEIIAGKAPFFFWPGEAGGFPVFYMVRMVLFFGLWIWFFYTIRKNMLAEDQIGGTSFWYKNRSLSAWFLVFFAVSSSVAAWDWVMSIDTHWFSTMFGWYVFASWWVTGLAFITLIVVYLKDAGYLKIVNANHLHDLGKFVFAFSIFWTYIWFGQFLLIWYAHIPEETVYFVERMSTPPYSWIFFANLILNFVLPFLLLMTRDAKRQMSMLKLVAPIVIVGHWFDFYNMVTPGVMKTDGGLGFIEIGTAFIFLAAFLWVTLSSLSKMPLFGKNHPMLEESLHHHI
ncbi:MAG: quinol:cytochrome C oxidoreductase [Cyclobacteriaceae bacterium]|nr:quinol:cytochrome C oxidoreductase [Cyclobacteriaceae bacterium]MDW8330527.1 quinol:cytochrome C oxidoreductase [Cyclobacteriaceae bacterium]